MARYHGKDGRLYMSASGGGSASPVASLSSWSLDMATDKPDVTAFGDTNKTYVQGLKDLKGDFSGFWDDTDDMIFDAAESSTPVKIYLYPSLNAVTIYHYGTAYVDASIETPVDGPVKVSGSFVAATSWGRKP